MSIRTIAWATKAIIAAFVVVSASVSASAQSYPNRIIRLIVPYLAGGGTDVMTRRFASEFEKILGQTVIVENRSGAGGLLGTQSVIGADPDGYTFLVGDNSTNSFIPALAKVPRYNPVVDLTPISLLLDVPYVLVVNPNFPAKTLAELLDLAKKKPGFYNSSTAGVGSFAHVATELLNVLGGTKIICVPYRGGAEALPAVLRGDAQMGIMPVRNVLPYVQNGQLRPIAVTSQRRAVFLPDVPTAAETLPKFSAENWYGLYAPPKLPGAILTKVADAVSLSLDSAAMKKFASDGGTEIQKTTPAQFKAMALDDYNKWAKVINDANIPKN